MKLTFRAYTSTYLKTYDESKCMCFLIEDEEFLEKYNQIWEKVSNSFEKYLIANRSIGTII